MIHDVWYWCDSQQRLQELILWKKHTTFVLYDYIKMYPDIACWFPIFIPKLGTYSIIHLSFAVKIRVRPRCEPPRSADLYILSDTWWIRRMFPFPLQYISIDVTNSRFSENFLGRPWLLPIYVSLPEGISPLIRQSHRFSGTMSQDSQAKDRHWFCTLSAVSCGKLGLLPSGSLTVCFGKWPIYKQSTPYTILKKGDVPQLCYVARG